MTIRTRRSAAALAALALATLAMPSSAAEIEMAFIHTDSPGDEFTFTNERLWRNNLRDTDGDGAIAVGDGVDLNRNFGSNWGRDDEG